MTLGGHGQVGVRGQQINGILGVILVGWGGLDILDPGCYAPVSLAALTE